MRKAEKEMYMNSFPAVNPQTEIMMGSGNRSANYAVCLAVNNNLFIRCYHRYSNGRLLENNRYVFTEKGCCRYGLDDSGKWKIRRTVTEPVFAQFPYYTSYMNAEYSLVGIKQIQKTCMKYCGVEYYKPRDKISYMKFWQKHKAAELLLKAGFSISLDCDTYYNWNAENLSDAVGLSKGDMKYLIKNKRQEDLLMFKDIREKYHSISAERIINIIDVFGYRTGERDNLCRKTGLEAYQIAEYLKRTETSIHEYNDYIEQCRQLGYDTGLKAVNRPKNLNELHGRYTQLIKIMIDNENKRKIKEASELRKFLEFSYKNLFVVLPKSADEIIQEGKILAHCVGSYAERHAQNKLSVLFLRTADKPDVPYYTIEVSSDGRIVQCRGFKNNVIKNGGTEKTQDILDFEMTYQKYLDKIFKNNVRFA